jgi:histone H3/H4
MGKQLRTQKAESTSKKSKEMKDRAIKAPRVVKSVTSATKTPLRSPSSTGGGLGELTERKKFRFHPGTVAARECKKYENQTDPFLARKPLRELLKDMISEVSLSKDMRLSGKSVDIIREVAEEFITNITRGGYVFTKNSKRVELTVDDMRNLADDDIVALIQPAIANAYQTYLSRLGVMVTDEKKVDRLMTRASGSKRKGKGKGKKAVTKKQARHPSFHPKVQKALEKAKEKKKDYVNHHRNYSSSSSDSDSESTTDGSTTQIGKGKPSSASQGNNRNSPSRNSNGGTQTTISTSTMNDSSSSYGKTFFSLDDVM